MEQLRRDGVALAYQEAGSTAPPIVLVHDLGSDHTCFASQFEHFRCRHRVVPIDLRGHGQSDKPSQPYAVVLLADDLAWLCYELGLYRPVVLGRGLGGMVALDLADRYQDLPAAIVATFPEHKADCLLEEVSTSDLALATHGSVVPLLRVAFDIGGALPEGINVLVDEFLPKLAKQAPP